MNTELAIDPPPGAMVTSRDVEHPQAVSRRIKAGLTFVGAAAATILALAASPTANADRFSTRPEIPRSETHPASSSESNTSICPALLIRSTKSTSWSDTRIQLQE